MTIRWCHYECDGISNHQAHNCLLKCLFRCGSKETSKLRVIGLCAGNSPVTGEFPTQRGSNAENVSIWWRHHVIIPSIYLTISYDFFIISHHTISKTNCSTNMWESGWRQTYAVSSVPITGHPRCIMGHVNPLPPGPWFKIKMSSYQYRKFHCGDKTVVRSSYLHNGISYTGKMASLYWFSPQGDVVVLSNL